MQKKFECDVESCYENISKIRHVSFIFSKFQNFYLKIVKKKLNEFVWILKCQKIYLIYEGLPN